MKIGCCEVEDPQVLVSASFVACESDKLYTVTKKRKAVFLAYRAHLAEQGTEPLFFEGTEDLLERARSCAQTIVANECPHFALAHRVDGFVRVVPREAVEQFPHRYTVHEN